MYSDEAHQIYVMEILLGFVGGWLSHYLFAKLSISRTRIRNDKEELDDEISPPLFDSGEVEVWQDDNDKEELCEEKFNSSSCSGGVEAWQDDSDDTEDELSRIFEEEHQLQSKTTQEKLDVGRKVGEEPVAFYTNTGGSMYATIDQVRKSSETSEKFRNENKLKRSDELEIMHTFNNIRGMNYCRASIMVKEQGYSLHPIYINRGKKNPRRIYSGTVLGVSIEDEEYDFYGEKVSLNAVVTCIVDVGGQDPENRGSPSKI